jgi:hypothetical protein
VTGTFEQSVRFDGVDREELPASSPAEETNWYRALKVPVVGCRFTVRGATALHVPDLGDPVFDLSWRGAEHELRFDTGVTIKCSHPNLEIEATDRIVAWRKVKFWRILGAESEGPWEGE